MVRCNKVILNFIERIRTLVPGIHPSSCVPSFYGLVLLRAKRLVASTKVTTFGARSEAYCTLRESPLSSL
jgi:hypothetical protein